MTEMEGADNTTAPGISNGRCESVSLAASTGESDSGLPIVFTDSASFVSRVEEDTVDGDRHSMLAEWARERKGGGGRTREARWLLMKEWGGSRNVTMRQEHFYGSAALAGYKGVDLPSRRILPFGRFQALS